MKKNIIFLFLLLFLSSPIFAQKELTLEKVTVVSRHSVRAPLEKYLSTLDEMTGGGYQWTRWSVPGSHLTLKGGALEMLFGEYFRLWLQEKDFKVDSTDVYFGASSKQRTIATARAFAAGAFPQINSRVDFKLDCKGEIGVLDPDYLPLLNAEDSEDGEFNTDAFRKEAYRELGQLRAPSFALLEEVLRMGSASYVNRYGEKHFDTCVKVSLDFRDKKGNRLEPTMNGGLKDANMASDAFILQYYEIEDTRKAAFDHRLDYVAWKELASIKDFYGEILFSRAPIIAVNVSHRMLMRIWSEMLPEGHKFAFFCTHDSMLESLLAALRVNHYVLTNTIESRTPIGGKVLFEQWTDAYCDDTLKYVRVRYVYQADDQIRNMEQLDLTNPPMSCELSFEGLEKQPNGMYKYEDFMRHLQNSIEAYEATARGKHPWKQKKQ